MSELEHGHPEKLPEERGTQELGAVEAGAVETARAPLSRQDWVNQMMGKQGGAEGKQTGSAEPADLDLDHPASGLQYSTINRGETELHALTLLSGRLYGLWLVHLDGCIDALIPPKTLDAGLFTLSNALLAACALGGGGRWGFLPYGDAVPTGLVGVGEPVEIRMPLAPGAWGAQTMRLVMEPGEAGVWQRSSADERAAHVAERARAQVGWRRVSLKVALEGQH